MKPLVVIPSNFQQRIDPYSRMEYTVTLKPRQYKKSARQQYQIARDTFEVSFAAFQYTAVAELTTLGNIHVHALFEYKDQAEINRFQDIVRTDKYNQIFGKCTFRQVQYYESYCKYMMKDIEKTSKILDMYALIENKLCLPTVSYGIEDSEGSKETRTTQETSKHR